MHETHKEQRRVHFARRREHEVQPTRVPQHRKEGWRLHQAVELVAFAVVHAVFLAHFLIAMFALNPFAFSPCHTCARSGSERYTCTVSGCTNKRVKGQLCTRHGGKPKKRAAP